MYVPICLVYLTDCQCVVKKNLIIPSSDMMDSWLSVEQFVWESGKDNEKENGEGESEG